MDLSVTANALLETRDGKVLQINGYNELFVIIHADMILSQNVRHWPRRLKLFSVSINAVGCSNYNAKLDHQKQERKIELK